MSTVNQFFLVTMSIKNIPKKSTLKKFKTDVRIFRDKHIRDLISWWVKDKNGELIQVNTKDE